MQEVQPIKSTTGEGNSKAKACTKPTGLGPVGQAAWYFQPDRSKVIPPVQLPVQHCPSSL